jgi:hypothetical protein
VIRGILLETGEEKMKVRVLEKEGDGGDDGGKMDRL